MRTYYLAVDIGASSGRHILGYVENGRLELEEVYRFSNGMVRKDGRRCWDTEALFGEVLAGLARCAELGKRPVSMGIDTWGVDYVLLDGDGKRLGDCVAYRDKRTGGMDEALRELICDQALYQRTGIQKQSFNTIYQFMALRRQEPELLEKAAGFLLMPEYFSYLLTGKQAHEYTICSTTGLLNVRGRQWDMDIVRRLDLPERIFSEVYPPGKSLGIFRPEIAEKVGFSCDVLLPCTHDTASAVVGAPIGAGSLFLSSGTWSLMGAELAEPITSERSNGYNLTNEGGYGDTYRYLKNIMGLWIVQNVRQEMAHDRDFGQLFELAREASDFSTIIDVDDPRFMAPEDMTAEIKAYCREGGLAVPETIGELMHCIYHSLAVSYGKTAAQIEELTGRGYDTICIVGGGSKNAYLNEMTADICKKKVSAGPSESTALGNIIAQMIEGKEIRDIAEGRQIIRNSFEIKEYE